MGCLQNSYKNIEEKLKNLPRMDKAFFQQDLADLVIGFYAWGDIGATNPELIKKINTQNLSQKRNF
ncbi:MAG: hypothetical protein V1891_04680 [bacterium]